MSRGRWIARSLAGVAAATVAGALCLYLVGERSRTRDWRDQFVTGRGELVLATEHILVEDEGHSLLHFRLADDGRLHIQGNLRVPSSDGGPYPVLLILGGLRTGRETLAYLGPSEGVILAAIDYPYEGPRHRLSKWEIVPNLPAMRRALLDTPPAAMLVVDYLLRRPDVDPERIVLVGGSLGALFAPAVALDERISAVALVLGGADLQGLARANLKAPAHLRPLALWLVSVLAGPVEPARHVGRIAPRPLLMINATEDAAIPTRKARLLHEAAGEPKSVRWISAGHVNVRDLEFGRLVVRELVDWLVAHDLAPPQALGLGAATPSGDGPGSTLAP